MDRRDYLHLSYKAALLAGFSPYVWGVEAQAFKDSKDTIKIGYLPITDHLLIIAKAYRNAAFTPVKFASWADLSEALRSKSIDGAFILTPLALRLRASGLDIKALLAAHRNGSALVVKKGILHNKEIANLKGLKIAIPSRFSTHYLLLCNLLALGNLSINDVKLVDMAPPEMLFALQSSNIDAFIVAEPFCIAAQNASLGDVFILSKDIINNHICCVLSFHNQVLKDRTQEVFALVRDFLSSAAFINSDTKGAAKLSSAFLGQKPALIENLLAINERVVYKHLKLESADIEHTLADMKTYKVDEKITISYEDFVDNSFIDEFLP